MSKSLGCHETFHDISVYSGQINKSGQISTTLDDVTIYSCLNSCETASDEAVVISSAVDPTSNEFRFQEKSSVCQSARFNGFVPLEPFQVEKVNYLGGYSPILRNGIESYSSSSGPFSN